MRPTTALIALWPMLLLTRGCRTNITPTAQPPAPSAAVAQFERLARDRGSVTFRSWNGRAFRTDSDTELTFYPDHSVHMFEWGFGLSSYRGSYHVHQDGRIVARFKQFDQEWPVMVVYRDGDALMLRPWDTDVNFVMGNRGRATIPGGKRTYWPFRMITGDDEQNVLEMIKERAERPNADPTMTHWIAKDQDPWLRCATPRRSAGRAASEPQLRIQPFVVPDFVSRH
jgi:hypothetical protein